jgi:hypothetical protein
MIVELLKPWRRWDAGFRLEKTAGAADMLIRRGIAKAVDGEAKPKAEPSKKAIKKAAPKRTVKKAAKAARSVGNTKRTTKKASQ